VVDGIRLRLLGVPAVDGPGEDPAGILSQPKRLALLAYLAIQGGFVRREVLVEMFWPDSDPEKARRALSQATLTLRRSLGRTAIRSRGNEELGISPDHVWIDVRAFEAAIAGERWPEAVKLHRDELLHGLNGDQVTPEFSRWLDGERLRLQRAAAGAAKRLADASFKAGDVPAAIAWARRAVAVRPLDESIFREYLALLDEAGDAAQALSEFESFRSRLGTEYDLEPARETVRLIEMIRSQRPESPSGRTAESAITTVPDFAVAAGATRHMAGPPAPAGDPPRRGWRRVRPAAIGVLAVVAMLLVWLNMPSTVDATPAIVPNRVAVLHLTAMGDSTAQIIAEGVTDILIEHLRTYSAIEVLPRSAVQKYRDVAIDLDSLVPALRAAFFVYGSVRRLADQTQVSLEVTGADGTAVNSDVLTFDGANPAIITEEVLTWVAESIPQLRSAVLAREIRFGTTDSLAAIYTLQAIAAQRNAIDFGSTGAFDLVADQLHRADSLLGLAIERDSRWSKPYLYRGRLAGSRIRMCYPPFVDCEWEQAFDEGIGYLSAIVDRDDNSAEALEERAQLRWLSWSYGVAVDTAVLNLAVSDASDAIELGGVRPLAHSVLTSVYMERGEWEDAWSQAVYALDRDEFGLDRGRILADLFDIAFNMKRDSLALEFCDSLRPMPRGDLRFVHCNLVLRAWSDVLPPDVAGSRQFVDAYLAGVRGDMRHGVTAQVDLLFAGVLARAAEGDAGQQDEVARLVESIVEQHEGMDERFLYAAAAMARLGRIPDAADYLERYFAVNTAARWYVSTKRWFEDVSFESRRLDPAEVGSGRDRQE
jgi:DNA-binding SARP family transcriptional activator/TolB-like protein